MWESLVRWESERIRNITNIESELECININNDSLIQLYLWIYLKKVLDYYLGMIMKISYKYY